MEGILQPVWYHTVIADESGQRIDNILCRLCGEVPKSRLYRAIRGGEVRVNKGRIKPDYRVKKGDLIRVPPMFIQDIAEQKKSLPSKSMQQAIASGIVFEDDDWIILNKPSGIAVHGGSNIANGVIETLRHLRPDAPYLELGHRIDRETSGCLLMAKSRQALIHFHACLQAGEVNKIYLALVKNQWQQGDCVVDAALLKNRLSADEHKVLLDEEGKAAQTHFHLIRNYANCALIEAKPYTGRTHQIRVHALAIDHPLAGDRKYSDHEFNKTMQTLGCRRLFLHAHHLAFTQASGKLFQITVPLAEDLQQVLDNLV